MICNGFQILTEAKLLKGTLIRNSKLKFVCSVETLIVENNTMFFTKDFSDAETINLPIAHHDGNYFADENTIKKIEDSNMIVFKYCEKKIKSSELDFLTTNLKSTRSSDGDVQI